MYTHIAHVPDLTLHQRKPCRVMSLPQTRNVMGAADKSVIFCYSTLQNANITWTLGLVRPYVSENETATTKLKELCRTMQMGVTQIFKQATDAPIAKYIDNFHHLLYVKICNTTEVVGT